MRQLKFVSRCNTRALVVILVALTALATVSAAAASDRAHPPLEGTEQVQCVFHRGETECVIHTFEYQGTSCQLPLRFSPTGPPPWELVLIDRYVVTATLVRFQGNRTTGVPTSSWLPPSLMDAVRLDWVGRTAYNDYKRNGGRLLETFVADVDYRYLEGPECGLWP